MIGENLGGPQSGITADMVEAKKVVFMKPIFEDSFVERGMKAWLTGVEWNDSNECYQLFFDFSEFEKENAKYFRETYYPNRFTSEIEAKTGRKFFTAIEAGYYNVKTWDYLSVGDERDDAKFVEMISEYIKAVD